MHSRKGMISLRFLLIIFRVLFPFFPALFQFFPALFPFFRVLFLILSFSLSTLLLSSCRPVGPDFCEPLPPCNETYTEKPLPCKTVSTPIKGGRAQYFSLCEEIPCDWWTLFHSKELIELINLGFKNNPTIAVTEATLHQSYETMQAYIGANMFPTVYGAGTAGKERFSKATIGNINQPATTFTLYTATLNISYNLDVWGGIKRQIESMAALVENKYFLMEAAYLTLASNIVTTAITEASLREQINATIDLIRLYSEQLEIMNKQYQLGGISLADVLTQKTQLEQIRATLPPLEKNLSVARHALARLVGFMPSDRVVPCFCLDNLKLPEVLPVSLPSDLVRQRPDIRASEALVHQAAALVGVATANLYPQFSLSATYGTTANTTSDLFKNISNVWSYTGQVIQPIFNGGSLRATRRAAMDAYEAAFSQYRETVLLGFQNVADSLRAIEIDARELKIQTIAEKTAKETFLIVQKQYKLGGVNYLLLLNAEQQYQQARLNRIRAQAARFTDTAALFQALGGGWWQKERPCS